ncbi:hypothetical protein FGO68_gene10418 [Halteria grandinella]|uniref:Uncharacterized protein n=1 Tax=Halteria grandinella TaxID=5974 RepID=A0A8J8NVP8_HALGN|nr:hypothetical protein FGO68_gene10418 [Halteria grandinella]
MEKVDLDRPQTIRDKAEYVLKLNNSIDSSLSKSADRFQIRLQSKENPSNELKALQTIRKQTKQRLEIQKQAYLQMLDYVRQKQGRQYRVSENERKIFDALKIITEACWIIQGEEQLVNLLHEIGVSLDPFMPSQLKDFLDVLFGLMGFSKLYLSEIN